MTKEQFDLKYRGEKVAVHCDTEEKAKAYFALEDSHGTVWGSGKKLDETDWDCYKKETCYSLFKDGTMGYSPLGWFKSEGYKIVEFELDEPNKTPHDKLLDMGFTFDVDVDWANMDFSHNWRKGDQRITIYLYDKTVTTYEVCKEAIAVLTEYLEWLEEEK